MSEPTGWRTTWRVTAAVVILGLLGTVFAWMRVDHDTRARGQADFDALVDHAVLGLGDRLLGFERALHGGAGLFRGSEEVTQAEWHDFAAALDLPRLQPGAVGVGYVARVPAPPAPRVPRRSRATLPDSVWPAAAGAERYPLVYLEPATVSSAGAVGFDLASEPVRRQTIQAACRSGRAILSPPIRLVQDRARPVPAATMMLPVYGEPRAGGPGAICPDSTLGLMVLPFHPDALLADLAVDQGEMLELALADQVPGQAPVPLVAAPSGRVARFERVRPVRFGTRVWLLEARSRPAFEQLHSTRAPVLILLGGLAITALAGALAGTETRRRAAAQRAAAAMGQALQRTASALDQTSARLEGVVDSAMDAIIALNHQGRIQVFNAAAERIFRCRAAEVRGRHFFLLVPPRLRDGYLAELRALEAGGARHQAVGPAEAVMARRLDGEEFPIEATIARSDSEGHPAWTLILRDVSDQRAAEADRRRLELQLRQAQKLEAIGTLAGGIAHDFNNILGAILGNAELAWEDLPDGHAARESLDEIRTAGRRGRDLVRGILAFTRRQEQERRPLELAPVAGEVVRLLQATVPPRVTLRLAAEPGCPAVLADPTQMHQVLMNLCTNGVQAIGDRPGAVTVRLRRLAAGSDPELAAPLDELDCLELSVTDDGEGMPPEVMERMFEPFYTTKPVGQGSGLGLSVVHGIVQHHDGQVLTRSRPGEGTCIRILLPEFVADRGEIDTRAGPLPRGRGERVLLVDDEPALLSVGERILRRLGYEPVPARGPTEALRCVRDDPRGIDMVLTDYSMPGIPGTELARELLKLRPGLPILLLTGYGLTATAEQLRAQGIRGVVAKPVMLRTLAEALERLGDGGGTDGNDSAGGG